jgi:hypothetical protein
LSTIRTRRSKSESSTTIGSAVRPSRWARAMRSQSSMITRGVVVISDFGGYDGTIQVRGRDFLVVQFDRGGPVQP